MGFTIGTISSGIRDFRELRPSTRRRTRRTAEYAAVTEYTGFCGWSVVPGARAVRSDVGAACSCGAEACPAPGAHPLDAASEIPAGLAPQLAAAAWARTPGAALLLPTGRSFDVLEVSEVAGRRAMARLERMGLSLGPVAVTPHGRAWFLVAPGAAAALPQLLYRVGWDDTGLDLRCLGEGDFITAPPSDLGGHGAVRWLRAPRVERAGAPPARLLLGTLAYDSHRSAA